MSMSLGNLQVRLENPSHSIENQTLAESDDSLKDGVPSVASLRKFAARVRFGLRHRGDRGDRGHAGLRNGSHHAVTGNRPHGDTVQLEVDASSRESQRLSDTSVAPEISRADQHEATGSAPSNVPPASRGPSEEAETTEAEETQTRGAEGTENRTVVPLGLESNGGDGIENTENENRQSDLSNVTSSPSTASRVASTMTTATSASTISASAKGKEPMRRNPLRSLNVHVPRSKRERLLQVRIATPDVLKAELVDVEHSTVDRERLASFCRVLSSKKHRLELFGREMPLSRFSLVQVTEGSSPPNNYICVHGLSTQNDITKFHSVMSQERYRPLYLPLKLCYDTARLSKVGSTDPPGRFSWEGAPTGALTPIVEPNEDEPSDTATNGLQSFHIYQPVHGDETYCGALFQTLVDGKPWTSTLGGMIDIAGSLYIMSCRHNPIESIETYNCPSSAETLLEKGFADDVEEALVFTKDGFDDGTNAFQASHSGQSQELGNDPFAHDRTWKHLNLPGSIKTGPEWCLLPVTSHSMLPNFVTISAKKRGTVDRAVRKYLEQIAEPLGGRPALIGTGVGPHPSGTVLGGSSFILGGGSDGLIEVWTVLLDKDEVDIKKGDSGSWVVDTSDPIHYKVIGSAVATSNGAAHFVGLMDQFSEILESTGNAGPISLVPPFRALVNCANLAFLSSDPRCDDFIDEALSPVVLEQCTKEWYMSGLKSILSVQNHSTSSEKGVHFPEQSNPARRLVVKSLLLEYGIELLDSLLEPSDFISSHRSEFSTPQWQALRVLQDVLLQSRTKEVEHLKRVRVVDKAPRRTSSGLPISSSTFVNPPRQDPWARNRVAASSPDRTQRQDQANRLVFGLALSPKHPSISLRAVLIILVVFMLLEGLASVSGLAGAAVIYAVESRTNQQTNVMTITDYGALGAVVGPISAAVLMVQVLLIYLSQRFQWSLLCGRRSLAVSATGRVILSLLIILASVFARTMLPALYVANQRAISENQNTLIAAAAMAGPSMLSTTYPSIIWTFFYSRGSIIPRRVTYRGAPVWLITYSTYLILLTGLDTLAGYTFGKISQNTGRRLLYPSSAAAGAAVFSIFNSVLVLAPFGAVMQFLSHRMNDVPQHPKPSHGEPRFFSQPQLFERSSHDIYELEAFPQLPGYSRSDGAKQIRKDEKKDVASGSQSKKSGNPTKAYPPSVAESSSSSPWGPSTTWGGSTLQDTLSYHAGTSYMSGASTVPTAYHGSAPNPLSRSEFVESQAPDGTGSSVVAAPRPLPPPASSYYTRLDPYTIPGIPTLGASLLSTSHAVPDPNATLSSDLRNYLESQPVHFENPGYRKRK